MASVLIIDDDPLIREMVTEMVELAGHTPTAACNGEEGLKLLESQEFDLVLTDIVMPEKEGIETIMAITALYPDLPIIAMSGGGKLSPDSYLKTASRLGARHVFPKPFDRRELISAVAACLAPESRSE